jgi:nitric oxide reductase NorQ protein
MPVSEAVLAAIIEPLTDEPDVKAALLGVAKATFA